MALSLQDQEQLILNTLIEHYSYSGNELLQTGVQGCLNTFDYSGCATGILPFLDFAKSRRLLLDILKVRTRHSNNRHPINVFRQSRLLRQAR